jgi:hypothetical protein
MSESPMKAPSLRQRPILIGGTGRSGSTIVGDLLDHHPDLTLTRPMEVRFITGHNGFADALHVHLADGRRKGRKASQLAVERLANRWYRRTDTVGLHQSVTPDELRVWSQNYLDTVEAEPVAATRVLVDRVMTAIADRLDATRWVDTTPANARLADYVEPIYPESRVVVVTRDGRDVAASFVAQDFGPDDVFEALSLWETRMLRSYQAMAASRPERILVLPLLDLVVNDRAGSLQTLCDFIEVPVAPGMVAWFDENVSPEQMHPGRWRSQFDPEVTARVDQQYSAACKRLIGHGIPIPA